ncbi:MAG: hypothetical protein LJE96_04370 [Deltaproteobacteria bacterium]|nr:hypothetical protein [Deltaproteobacteria bacterium]
MTPGKRRKAEGYKVACFVSPHGFGHAARTSAIMSAMHERNPKISFEIFTTVPQWFFAESLSGPFCHHSVHTDVGLVQKGPLCADLPGTVKRLDQFLPFDPGQLERMAKKLNALGCAMVLCDISPLGIAVAGKAGIPSVLVENFTWDWVYQEYVSEKKGFMPHIKRLEALFSSADFHIQTSPVCAQKMVQLRTAPISRRPRNRSTAVRKRLGVSDFTPLVLITMGGIPKHHGFIDQLLRQKGIFFVAPGGGTNQRVSENVMLLPHHSQFFHPDLVHAADAVVGKVGYSTLAEVYHAGVPYGYIKRKRFQESEVLSGYIERYMAGFAIDETEFENGKWILRAFELLDLPTKTEQRENGADTVADFILALLDEDPK